tara:strand:+ start:4787 stop:5119 length:333 start_codon:yes stop_codon:yes gene_type:complete
MELVTTLAQLNFFRWAIEHGLLKYAHKHSKEIECDMVVAHRRPPPGKTATSLAKRPRKVAAPPALGGSHQSSKGTTENRPPSKRRRELSESRAMTLVSDAPVTGTFTFAS